MFIQVEIGTYCNFSCFYCSGRKMKQEFVSLDDFKKTVDSFPKGPHIVNIHGEGEPTMHPDFWSMVDYVRSRGHKATTITNCSKVDPDKLDANFENFAISIDTLDPVLSEKIGRKNLSNVLENLDKVLKKIGDPSRITILTVDFGQDITPLFNYVKSKGLKHTISPLQTHSSYSKNYAIKPVASKTCSYSCKFLNEDVVRAYGITGSIKPCCVIKDETHFVSIEDLRATLKEKKVPKSCEGCAEIYGGIDAKYGGSRTYY